MLGRFAMAEELLAGLQRDEALLLEVQSELQAQESAISGMYSIVHAMDDSNPEKGRLLDALNAVLGHNHTVAEQATRLFA